MASGAVSEAMVRLREMIAGLAAFRAWVDVDDELTEEEQQTAAEARVHLQEAAKDAPRPRAFVAMTSNIGNWRRVATGTVVADGELLLMMEHPLSGALDGPIAEDELLAFTDAVGGIAEGLGLRGEYGPVGVRGLQGMDCGLSDPERDGTEELFLFAVLRVEWGSNE